ncbi:GrpB family protein [Halobium salinum]|uniref:GrpB family protein n=1 Tax=Halobium salinum TaxID=1364940 RepID=A0ABD5PG51_9EURY|nr:GrpB family protein [Halobium salinum]
MVGLHDDPIALVPSRHGEWRESFEAERERLVSVLQDRSLDDRLVRLEHVGSTAVPDLAAKDIVDVDLVVGDGAVGEVASAVVDDLGGTRYENSDEWNPVAREHDGQRFNVHVFAESGEKWRVSVVTRDVLRARDDLREEYEELKRDLATGTDDLEEYSMGKTEFVERVLRVARDGEEFQFEFAVPGA